MQAVPMSGGGVVKLVNNHWHYHNALVKNNCGTQIISVVADGIGIKSRIELCDAIPNRQQETGACKCIRNGNPCLP